MDGIVDNNPYFSNVLHLQKIAKHIFYRKSYSVILYSYKFFLTAVYVKNQNNPFLKGATLNPVTLLNFRVANNDIRNQQGRNAPKRLLANCYMICFLKISIEL